MAIAKYLLIIAVGLGALLFAHNLKRWRPPLASQGASDRSANRPGISGATALWMLERARTQLARGAVVAAEPGSANGEASQAAGESVFLSVYAGMGSAANDDRASGHRTRDPFAGIIGRGPNLESALNDAVSNVLAARGPAGYPLSMFFSPAYRIKIDVLTGAFDNLEKPDDPRTTAADLIATGSQGLDVAVAGSHFYLLPSELIYSGLVESSESETAEDMLGRAMLYLGFESGRWRSRDVTLRAFRTASFVEDASHTRALGLVRGFVFPGASDRETLLAAARNAGDYLVRMQRAGGSFYYWYRPLSDQVDASHYNIVRHAGTAVSLFDLYSRTGEARYLAAARKSMVFLRSRFRQFDRPQPAPLDPNQSQGSDGASSHAPSRQNTTPGLYVLDDDNKAKLGAGGLALLAVTREIELDHKSLGSEPNGLATGILAMQRPDGSFETDFKQDGEESDAPPSLYYPGEAMLGLIRLYRLNNDRRLLDAARRGADYLVGAQRKQGELPPDAWLVQALESLFDITKDPKYAEHALDLAMSMAASLYPPDGPEGYAGAVAPGIPRVTPAASRSEGILAGYRIALATKDSRSAQLLAAARAAARFQVSQQFGPDNSFFLPNPGRAAGGFHESLDSTRIRIDYVQHNISSLLALAEVRNQ